MDNISEFIDAMITDNPFHSPNLSVIMHHPWFRNKNDDIFPYIFMFNLKKNVFDG